MTRQQAFNIASLCLQLLDKPEKWKHPEEFNAKCSIGDDSQSLSCALKLMSISVVGEFKSRSLIMRRTRWKIRQHYLWRHGWHPLNHFNNHRNTTYNDVMFLLTKVRDSLGE